MIEYTSKGLWIGKIYSKLKKKNQDNIVIRPINKTSWELYFMNKDNSKEILSNNSSIAIDRLIYYINNLG